jgi:hypothetical protein
MIKFRGHSLVIGATGTGKGVLTSTQAEAFQRAGMKVFLLCNKQDEYDDFPADFKTMRQDRLIEEVKKLRPVERGYVDTLVVIDEAWDWDWKRKGTGLQMVPNMARAHGVEMWVQSQFPTQMAPTVRANCNNVFCFLMQEPGAVDWAAKTYGDQFRKVQDLKPGQYIGKRGLEAPFVGWAWYMDKEGKFRKAGA